MKQSEAIEQIEAEILEMLSSLNNATDAAKPHIIKSRSAGILYMLEGFGMLPPDDHLNIHSMHEWSPEDEKK